MSLSVFEFIVYRLPVFVDKISSSSSGNIFTSKENEQAIRGQLTRRLAFALFCSDRRSIVRYLSGIQEKIVESLKLYPGSQSPDLFLLLRILLIRLGPDDMSSLWPIVLTEMVSILNDAQNILL